MMTVNPINELPSQYDSYLAVSHSRDRVEGVKRMRLFDATDVPWASSGRQVETFGGLLAGSKVGNPTADRRECPLTLQTCTRLSRCQVRIGRRQLSDSFLEVCPANFSATRKLTPVSTRNWSNPGVPLVESATTLLSLSYWKE